MAVWNYEVSYVNEQYDLGVWNRDELFEVPFDQGFHAWVEGDTYLFVTHPGKLCAGRKNEQGDFTTELRYGDDEKPLRAIVLGSDHERAYVFGQDFYFELTAAEPTPTPCRNVTDGRDDMEEPLRTIFECASVLVKKQEGTPPGPRLRDD